MLTAVGIVLFSFGILLSIALHEIGHLVPAKKFGVKVTEYMVGFGPSLWSRKRGETTYGVKWIPLGGYIRMIGMFPPAKDGRVRSSSTGALQSMVNDARHASAQEVQPGDEDRVFWKLPVRQKLVVMMGGPTMNLIIATVLFTIVLCVLGTPQVTTTVSQVSPCVPSSAASTKSGTAAACTSADPVTPAAQAGLKPGDKIVALNGQQYDHWADLTKQIRAHGGDQVTLTVERDGKTIDVPVTLIEIPRPNPDTNKTENVGFLGVTPSVDRVREPLTAVPAQMWHLTAATGKAIVSIPQRMVGVWDAAFGGGQRDPNGPIGVVGVTRIGGEVAAAHGDPISWKIGWFLSLLASLNLALFVFNLIPLLPLDGGHVAGALYEGAKRQVARLRHLPDPGPVDVARMLPVAYTVAFLLIGMSALLLYADIVNPIRIGG